MTAKEYYYNQFKIDFNNFWSKALRGPGYLRFTSFLKGNMYDALEDIDRDNLVYFLSALGSTIMVNRAMGRYFRTTYPKFREVTGFPAMEIGWSRDNPWIVLGQTVRLDRHLSQTETQLKFAEFAEFFTKDLEVYFCNDFKAVKWGDVKQAMVYDAYASGSEYGKIFQEKLTTLA